MGVVSILLVGGAKVPDAWPKTSEPMLNVLGILNQNILENMHACVGLVLSLANKTLNINFNSKVQSHFLVCRFHL